MDTRFLYTIFLGVLVALFIGSGVAAFYHAPKSPEYPRVLEAPAVTKDGVTVESDEAKAARTQYDTESKAYQKDYAKYNLNVSIITLIAAIIVLLVSLTLAEKIQLMSDGLLLGGILILLYSIIRGFLGENDIYRFLVTAVGLITALTLGYVKFVKPTTAHSKR